MVESSTNFLFCFFLPSSFMFFHQIVKSGRVAFFTKHWGVFVVVCKFNFYKEFDATFE